MMLLGGGLTTLQAQQLAFPGAEGFGKYAVGGRNGSVYHVTNLKDSGSGSLRDAVSQPNRIVVFDVAGVIKLESRLVFKNNLYVAGQTAPGEGITVYGNGVSFSGASNTIVRYLRFRMGAGGDSGKDAAGISNGTNMIFDHLSVSWGRDETFSISSDGKGDLGNITIQNSIISQGLQLHCAGGLVQADNITLYRNLYADNDTRNAKIKGKNQYVNNIVYNWSSGCFIMGGDSEGTHYANAQSNLFMNGPGGGKYAFGGANSDFHIYATDNWQDINKDGKFDPYEIPQSEFTGGPTFMTSPMEAYDLPIVSGKTLLDESLPTVGASLPYRDYADWYVVNEVKSYGKKGAFISNEANLPFGAPTDWNLWAGNKKTDTDGDGMPDAWENANGTDPAKNDAMTIASNGYANIENYINGITVADREAYLRVPLCVEMSASTQNALTLSWLNYTEGEEGIAVEMKKGSAFEEIGRTAADVSSFEVGDLEPGTGYVFRLRAFDASGNYSDYTSEITLKTRPTPVEMVDVKNYTPDYTWAAENGVWDLETDNWYDINEIEWNYEDGSKVLFNPADDITVTLNQTVSPASVVVADGAVTTITGEGVIAGTGSINKTGAGTLVLNTANTYTGQTVLHEGVIEFNTLKNSGVASSIGASEEFSQNWIWNGGVWKYTGESTSTNRSAILYEDTEFNIANSGKVVTMNGSLEGEGGLILNGSGQMKINTTGFFKYTGNTVLRGGTLNLASTEITKAGIGTSPKLVLAGGTFSSKAENSNYETYSFPIEVMKDTRSVFAPHRNCSIKSKVTGEGTLEYHVPYVREYITGDWSGFTGRLIAVGKGSDKDGSQLMMHNGKGKGIPNAVVELKGNTRVVYWSTNGEQYLGGLAGESTTYLSGSSKNTNGAQMTWIVGGAGTNETFRGVIDNRTSASGYNAVVSIVKEGIGDWRLTGKNIYSGTTTVNGGRLIVNGTHSGTGAVTVNEEGILAGFGTLAAAVTVNDGGMVAAGDTVVNSVHKLKLDGGLTVKSGGIVSFPISYDLDGKMLACRIAPKKTLLLNKAVLKIDMSKCEEELTEDCEFKLFDLSNTTSISGTIDRVEPAVPANGLEWDTSELLTTGILKVTQANAISKTKKENVAVYPLNVENELNVTVPEQTTVVIYSLTGEAVKSVAVQGGATSLNVADLSTGLYLIKVDNKVFRVVKK